MGAALLTSRVLALERVVAHDLRLPALQLVERLLHPAPDHFLSPVLSLLCSSPSEVWSSSPLPLVPLSVCHGHPLRYTLLAHHGVPRHYVPRLPPCPPSSRRGRPLP
eukprot:5085479-Pyramimonas_sp.AAC.1